MAPTQGLLVSVYYRLTWQVLLLLCAVLALGSEVVRPLTVLPFLFIAIGLMTGLGSRYVGRAGAIRRQLYVALVAAVVLLIIDEVLRIERFEQLVPAMLEVLCGFLPLSLLSNERTRSYWLAVLTTVVLAVGSISVTSSVVVYLAFFAYIGVLLLNLNAANLRRPEGGGDSAVALPAGYFRQFFQAAPAGGLAAVVIFLAFPRVQSFTLSLGSLVARPQTGYTGSVALSGDGEIQTSEALAFLVEASDKVWLARDAQDERFRGNALDTFDGVRWSGTVFHFQPVDRAGDVRLAARHGREAQHLLVHMEPAPNAVIFYPGVLMTLGPLQPSSAGHLLFNGNTGVVRDSFAFERFDYPVQAAVPLAAEDLPALPLARLGQASAPGSRGPGALDAKALQLYLAVPAAVAGAPYYQAWVRELGLDPRRATLAEAEARLTAYFAANFKATLANTFTGTDALAAFLTTERRGHCEYFATATALLLRTLGVPTRVVVGYRGGTYNQHLEMLEVREANAHAWVEAFVPGLGWHAVDPMPPALGGGGTGLAAQLRLYVNAATFLFRQYVIDYDQTQQRELLRSLKTLGERNKGEQLAWLGLVKAHAKALALAALALAALAVVAGRQLRRRRGSTALPRYYTAFLAKLEGSGHTRRAGETYAAFHARLAGALVLPEALPEVAAALERDLYAAQPVSEGQRAALLARVSRLSTASIRRARPSG